MSDTIYRVDTTYKQYEIANLIVSLDKSLSSVHSRFNEIDSRVHSLPPISPAKVRDLKKDKGPILSLTRKMDFTARSGLIKAQASEISVELEKSIEMMTIEPAFLKKERQFAPDVKNALAEIRNVAVESEANLLKGIAVEGVKIENLKLLKQDGNVYDIETLVQEGGKEIKVRSKVCILQDGSVTIHQIGDYPGTTCDKAAQQIAGTIDLALSKLFARQFAVRKENRNISGVAYVGGERITLEKSWCG